MGGGRWSSRDWSTYSTRHVTSKSKEEIFSSTGLDESLNPKGVVRESKDSKDNPESTPLIVGMDVTGSMGMVVEAMVRQGLHTLASQIYERVPMTDPHIMFMGIGDVEAGDQVPLQATQFEADIRIAEQVRKIFLEGGGGGNHYESYALAWLFAANQTVVDSFDKRKKKGYLFTVGDEEPTPYLRASDIEKVLGTKVNHDLKGSDILALASQKYEVFHVMVEEGSHYRAAGKTVRQEWSKLLGQRAIPLANHTRLAEVIVSTIEVVEGKDKKEVIKSWDKTVSPIIETALKDLTKKAVHSEGVVSL